MTVHYTKWRTTWAFFQFGWSRAVLDKKHDLKSIRINTRRFIGTWLDNCCPGEHPPPPTPSRAGQGSRQMGKGRPKLRLSETLTRAGWVSCPISLILSILQTGICLLIWLLWCPIIHPVLTDTEHWLSPDYTRWCKQTWNHDDISYLKWCTLFI